MVKLLELPTVELEDRVKSELLDNPALEEGKEETPENVADELSNPEDDGDTSYNALDDYRDDDDIPDYRLQEHNYSRNEKMEEIPFSDTTSFYETLKDQLGEHDLNEHQRQLADYLIGSLDDDGLLHKPLEVIADELLIYMGVETSLPELEEVLQVIQQFDPAGIGAAGADLLRSRLPAWRGAGRFAQGVLSEAIAGAAGLQASAGGAEDMDCAPCDTCRRGGACCSGYRDVGVGPIRDFLPCGKPFALAGGFGMDAFRRVAFRRRRRSGVLRQRAHLVQRNLPRRDGFRAADALFRLRGAIREILRRLPRMHRVVAFQLDVLSALHQQVEILVIIEINRCQEAVVEQGGVETDVELVGFFPCDVGIIERTCFS